MRYFRTKLKKIFVSVFAMIILVGGIIIINNSSVNSESKYQKIYDYSRKSNPTVKIGSFYYSVKYSNNSKLDIYRSKTANSKKKVLYTAGSGNEMIWGASLPRYEFDSVWTNGSNLLFAERDNKKNTYTVKKVNIKTGKIQKIKSISEQEMGEEGNFDGRYMYYNKITYEGEIQTGYTSNVYDCISKKNLKLNVDGLFNKGSDGIYLETSESISETYYKYINVIEKISGTERTAVYKYKVKSENFTNRITNKYIYYWESGQYGANKKFYKYNRSNGKLKKLSAKVYNEELN